MLSSIPVLEMMSKGIFLYLYDSRFSVNMFTTVFAVYQWFSFVDALFQLLFVANVPLKNSKEYVFILAVSVFCIKFVLIYIADQLIRAEPVLDGDTHQGHTSELYTYGTHDERGRRFSGTLVEIEDLPRYENAVKPQTISPV